ncbi:hypothetical protein PISMIDRAFT_17991 [Pisolithus microcarpus 441]|uniref:Reverse transcriptase Ty1/copia-type domain-containing protein n=1 Tax=Pisolithus microcarpus 441 TaxID=765257 RepID=A0A0C9YSY1_9AGAM|nr:hypothetical protein PISMIDRAFT_17991 [Pisolithus microcarpus 441]
MLYKKAPDLSNLPVWGCQVKVHDPSGSKLDARARDGHWLGFDAESDGHRVYWVDSKTVGVERSVVFPKRDISVSLQRLPHEGENEDLQDMRNGRNLLQNHTERRESLPQGQTTPERPALEAQQPTEQETMHHAPRTDHLGPTFETPPPLRRSARQRFESDYVRRLRAGEGTRDGRITLDYMRQLCDSDSHHNSPKSPENATLALIKDELTADDNSEDIYAMVAGVNWPSWEAAINAELKSLEAARTWDVVECPTGANVVGCKWVFKIKQNASGEIEKYKARLVAKGYSQVQGIDYKDTYAPVAQLSSLRTVLAIAARNDWDIEVFDFHSAFLNGKLSEGEDIYMQLPEGYATDGKFTRPVRKLNVALYGSKQGVLRWYQELSKSLNELGLNHAHADWGIFYGEIGHDILVLASHVNDCTVTGSSPELIRSFKQEVSARYKISDLGPISWLLGMQVTHDRNARTISLSQQTYTEAILAKYNLANSKPATVPMDPGLKLSRDQSPKSVAEATHMKNVPYRATVGSLMHLTVGTRPDIAFAVSTVAQFNNAPGVAHWEAVKQIYRYLAGTKSFALTFGITESGLVGYTDADRATQEHRHAISGYVYLLDGGAISWTSRKQELVTLSTAKAEYVAATHAAKEGLWL